ncbi:MAG: DUF4097 family beta strand repeat-containing protein [Mycobacteriales bacterium]
MPIFRTPDPVSVTVEVAAGDVRINATDREDTVVVVRPRDPSRESDVVAAERTTVEYSAGRLLIRGARQSALGLFTRAGSVDIVLDVPTGSSLQAHASAAKFHSTGALGECRVRTSAGDIELDSTGMLELSTGSGSIVVDRVAGDAGINTGSGRVRIGSISGRAEIKNANGDSWVGEAGGDLRISAANGDVSIDRALASVSAATANGAVRLREAARGSTSLKSGKGEIEIGIRTGTAARVDVATGFGSVRNQLSAADSPEPTDEKLDVRARTGYGDIVIRRA